MSDLTASGKAHESTNPTLTPAELEEFKIRLATLQRARAELVMLEESYQVWIGRIRDKYELAGPFDIRVDNGEMTPKVTGSNGRPHA